MVPGMKKTIGALIGAALFVMPGAVSAYCIDYCDYGYGGYGNPYYNGYPYVQDQCYCSGQGGFNHDPILYSYTPAYGYGGAGYDYYGNYYYQAPTYPTNSYPTYYYPTYTQPTYSYPTYSYPSQQYYPQQYYNYAMPYVTNTNLNFNNIVNNNNSNAISIAFGL
jgi:hypothetical protein